MLVNAGLKELTGILKVSPQIIKENKAEDIVDIFQHSSRFIFISSYGVSLTHATAEVKNCIILRCLVKAVLQLLRCMLSPAFFNNCCENQMARSIFSLKN